MEMKMQYESRMKLQRDDNGNRIEAEMQQV